VLIRGNTDVRFPKRCGPTHRPANGAGRLGYTPSMGEPPLKAFYEGLGVCITGGAGFIGSHLAERLLGLGAHVTVIDDLSNSSFDHVASMLDGYGRQYRFVHASILEPGGLDDAIAGADIVFHEAALGSVPRSVEQPERFHAVNATGTLRVLEAARSWSVRRVVYAASSSAYGDQPTLPKRESQMPQPRSPYAQSKLSGEHAMAVWAACYGLSTVSLRYFNVFGPRQRADSAYAAVIPAFAQALLDGRAPTIYGDGSQTRDFTHVDNVVQANLLAGASPRELQGEVVNIGAGGRISIKRLLTLIAELLGVDALPRYEAGRPGDVADSMAEIAAAKELLGYEPIVSVEDGLSRTVAWFRAAHGDTTGAVDASADAPDGGSA
jgi:nucleoside-diphosphate-sugar epimerase